MLAWWMPGRVLIQPAAHVHPPPLPELHQPCLMAACAVPHLATEGQAWQAPSPRNSTHPGPTNPPSPQVFILWQLLQLDEGRPLACRHEVGTGWCSPHVRDLHLPQHMPAHSPLHHPCWPNCSRPLRSPIAHLPLDSALPSFLQVEAYLEQLVEGNRWGQVMCMHTGGLARAEYGCLQRLKRGHAPHGAAGWEAVVSARDPMAPHLPMRCRTRGRCTWLCRDHAPRGPAPALHATQGEELDVQTPPHMLCPLPWPTSAPLIPARHATQGELTAVICL